MTATELIRSSVEDLLSPIGQSLASRAAGRPQTSRLAGQLRTAVEALEDAADDDWCACGRTLISLLEIVDCFAGGPDSLSEDTTDEILGFIESSLPQLQNALLGAASENAGSMSDLVVQARTRWGEYLSLLDGDAFADSSDLDTDVAEGHAAMGAGRLASSSAEQVDLILSAVREFAIAPSAESDDAAEESTSDGSDRLFKAERRSSPPAVPSAPQIIQISDVLREAYLEDAEQCLSSMERSVIAFENNARGDAPTQQLCRDLHTLKGASASIGLSQLATYLHQLEEWLQSCGPSEESAGLQPILDCVDFVRTQIEALQHPSAAAGPAPGAEPSPAPLTRSLAAVPAVLDRSAEPGEETVRVRSSQLDRMMNLLVDLVIWRRRRDRRVAELTNAGDELSRCMQRLETLAKGLSFPRSASARAGQGGWEEDTRESSNQLGEVTNDLREIAGSLRNSRQSLTEENRAVSQFIQQFRQQLAQARRVPLSGLFQRLQRVVREAARLEHKQVRLECIGQNTGLERSLQERLYEPLLHLVRNGVCHGIESPEQRVRAGKDPVGTITLEASGSSQMLLLEVRDDGGGLDFDAIRRRGIERGLVRPDEPVSPNELSRLIFHPGFSTRTEANEVAGRGVGMDVVLTALNRCHCQIDVHSEAGTGTTFRLAIPLPSVIEHSLVFRCGGQLFGLPMQFVMSTSLGEAADNSINDIWHGAGLELRHLLQLEGGNSSHESRSLVLESSLHSRPSTGHKAATSASSSPADRRTLIVEDILGPEEVVVRPLPPLLRRHPVLSGVTLSGAGEVVLLLDGPRLLKMAAETATSVPALGRASGASSNAVKRPRVLVAEDSLSARRRLVEKLQPHGFEITEVSDGVEALDCIRADTFDAIFSDLEMPGLNGFDLLTAIKSDERYPSKPVVIVTSRDEAETRAKAEELGADGFLSKPVNDAAIESLLKRLQIASPVFS